jgi:hypothetical protein
MDSQSSVPQGTVPQGTVPQGSVVLTLKFVDDSPAERQEEYTRSLYQQLQDVRGLQVSRVQGEAPEGAKSFGGFLWGLLQAEVSVGSVKTLFGFLGDRLGDKPIVIEAKFADGREFKVTANSRAELQAARDAVTDLAQIK